MKKMRSTSEERKQQERRFQRMLSYQKALETKITKKKQIATRQEGGNAI